MCICKLWLSDNSLNSLSLGKQIQISLKRSIWSLAIPSELRISSGLSWTSCAIRIKRKKLPRKCLPLLAPDLKMPGNERTYNLREWWARGRHLPMRVKLFSFTVRRVALSVGSVIKSESTATICEHIFRCIIIIKLCRKRITSLSTKTEQRCSG